MRLHPLFCLLLPALLPAPTAEDIIRQTEAAYAALDHYTDHGVLISRYDLSGSDRTKETKARYQVAVDRRLNCWLSFEEPQRDTLCNEYAYLQMAGEAEGVFCRNLSGEVRINRDSLLRALARLTGVCRGVFNIPFELMHPEAFKPFPNFKNALRNADATTRLPDTLLDGAPCYRIELMRKIVRTPKELQSMQRQRDSLAQRMIDSLYVPPEIVVETMLMSKPPSETVVRTVFYIRRSDMLVVRREVLRVSNTGTDHAEVLMMNPRANVPDFQDFFPVPLRP